MMKTKVKNILLWILSGWITLGYLFSGLSKIAGAEMQKENFTSWGYPSWWRIPVGIIELALAAGILVPRIRKLTLYGIFIWAAGAIYTLLQSSPPQYSMMAAPLVFLIPAVAILVLSASSKNKKTGI